MSDEELKELEREVKRRRRIAGEWASKLHDLVEDRLWSDYAELPALAQTTFEACQEWAESERVLKASRS